MLPGFNHNIKYQDRVYHVQTEDSGVRLGHVTTLLFIGGNVIASARTGYSELRNDPELERRLVEIMQTQHKAMLRALVSGRYDKEIAERSHNAATLNGPAPLNVEAGAQLRASEFVAPPPRQAPAAPKAPPQQAPDEDAENNVSDITQPHVQMPSGSRPSAPANAAPRGSHGAPQTKGSPPARASQAQKDAAQARRAQGAKGAELSQSAPAAKNAAPHTPASKGKKANRTEAYMESLAPFLTTQTGAGKRGASAAPSQGASRDQVLESEQLRSAFAKGDKAADDSIFGNLISPKSLDEVILSYLANKKPSDK